MPFRDNAVCYAEEAVDRLSVGNVPAVQECGVDHQKTDDRAEEDVAAEYTCCRNCYDNGQICESGVSNCVEECEPVGCAKVESGDLSESLDETHHKTGSYDCGQDRNEYIADCLQSLLPDGLLSSSCCLNVILGACLYAGDRDELVENLVNCTGTNDQLQLSIGFEHTLDTLYIVKSFLVDLAVISDNETKSGCAVRCGYDVGAAADIISDLLGTLVIIQCHK